MQLLKRFAPFGVVTVVLSCGPPRVVDDRAARPNYDRWLAIVPAPADSAYHAALRMLVDSGYSFRMTSNADRIISTNVRPRTTADRSFDGRLTLHILPMGTDSSRVSVLGESCHGESLESCYPITALDYGDRGIRWRFVRRIGDALLAQLQAKGSP